ncbi:hypothetical protein EVAR_99738_1 [Eumeta japonica]|uniref:Uncharacterized protein n=1 Tax=Eumeta variegata TaxID=151549 RepID=A0A4C1Z8G9_EUMVA|nr:hypothetical protein EVAR_99738_1 [Eumeta japonica]
MFEHRSEVCHVETRTWLTPVGPRTLTPLADSEPPPSFYTGSAKTKYKLYLLVSKEDVPHSKIIRSSASLYDIRQREVFRYDLWGTPLACPRDVVWMLFSVVLTGGCAPGSFNPHNRLGHGAGSLCTSERTSRTGARNRN